MNGEKTRPTIGAEESGQAAKERAIAALAIKERIYFLVDSLNCIQDIVKSRGFGETKSSIQYHDSLCQQAKDVVHEIMYADELRDELSELKTNLVDTGSSEPFKYSEYDSRQSPWFDYPSPVM